MLYNPVEESSLEADIIPGLLAFDPLMAKNLLALGQELLIEHRIFDQFCRVFVRGFHYYFASLYIWPPEVNQISSVRTPYSLILAS